VIIGSGRLKGRSLKTLGKQPWLRPTSDKAREGLMDVLRPVLAGARVIDVCSGTGAVGIEAISNGAAHVTFVDVDSRSVRLLRENASALGLREEVSVVKGDAEAYVSGLLGSEFDVLFADPPFDSGMHDRLLRTLSVHLRGEADDCIIIMEHASRQPVGEEYLGPAVMLEKYKERRYGDITMTFFRATQSRNEADSATDDKTT
jgi:16S rRNA (guanine966-N2)-methyltransferase